MYFFFHDLKLNNYYYHLLAAVVVLLLVFLLLLFFLFFLLFVFSGLAVDRVPVMSVKYPHCTPITPSRRTKLLKYAAPVPGLTLPRPE